MNLFVSCWRAHPHEANHCLLCNSSFTFLLGQKAQIKGNKTLKSQLFPLHGGGETGLRAALQNKWLFG